jgi:ATP-dependent DNA helicase RecG
MSDTTSPSPDVETALLAPARAPKGARKDTMDLIAKVAGGRLVRDLVFLPPNSAIDRRLRVPIGETEDGDIATIEAEVDGHIPSRRIGSRVLPHKVRLRDETGFLTITYFRGHEDMLNRMWPVGQTRLISGKISIYEGMRQMLHPDYVVDPEKGDAPPHARLGGPHAAANDPRRFGQRPGGARMARGFNRESARLAGLPDRAGTPPSADVA